VLLIFENHHHHHHITITTITTIITTSPHHHITTSPHHHITISTYHHITAKSKSQTVFDFLTFQLLPLVSLAPFDFSSSTCHLGMLQKEPRLYAVRHEHENMKAYSMRGKMN